MPQHTLDISFTRCIVSLFDKKHLPLQVEKYAIA